jgi:hypothetical protein
MLRTFSDSIGHGGSMPEQGVPGSAAVAAFVRELRKLQIRQGLTLRELERRARQGGYSLPKSTLGDALNGKRLPGREIVLNFVRACTQDETVVAEWARKWADLAEEVLLPDSSPPVVTTPGPAPTPSPGPRAEPGPVMERSDKDAEIEYLSGLFLNPHETVKIRLDVAGELIRLDRRLGDEIAATLLEIESRLGTDDTDARAQLYHIYADTVGLHRPEDAVRIALPAIYSDTAPHSGRLQLASLVAELGGSRRDEMTDFLARWLDNETDLLRRVHIIGHLFPLVPQRRSDLIRLVREITNNPAANTVEVRVANELLEKLTHDFTFQRLVKRYT